MTRTLPVQFTMRRIIKTTEPHHLSVGDVATFESSGLNLAVTVTGCPGPEHIEVDADFGGLAHGGVLHCGNPSPEEDSQHVVIAKLEAINRQLEAELEQAYESLRTRFDAEIEGPTLAPGMLLSSREGHVFAVVSCSLKSRASVATSPFSTPQLVDTTEVTLEQR